jgi:hypothetical protein
MLSLMTLPRELRDQICGYIIQFPQQKRPALDQTFDQLTQGRKSLKRPKDSGPGNNTVLNLPDGPVPNTAHLLRVNRQLHAETLENVKFLQACVYELDVIILDEILLLPTWIRVPRFATRLDRVCTTFRIAGRYDRANEDHGDENRGIPPGAYRRWNSYKGFRGGDGGGPAMSWQIYSILEGFSKYCQCEREHSADLIHLVRMGPAGKDGDANNDRHISIKTLDINVETPPGVNPDELRPPRSGGARYYHASDSVLDPRYLADFIAKNIRDLLGSGDATWFMYGKILYEHIDTVIVRQDGEELERFDVAERLKHFGGYSPSRNLMMSYEGYKTIAWKRRASRGLNGR